MALLNVVGELNWRHWACCDFFQFWAMYVAIGRKKSGSVLLVTYHLPALPGRVFHFADMKSTKTSFSPVKTRSMRQNEVALVGMEESASETPDEELSLYSLYSSGCITRGQISRAKMMIGDVMQEHNAFSKMPDSQCSNREEEKMDLDHSNLPLQSAFTSSKKLGKSLVSEI